MGSMKTQKDITVKDKAPRSAGVQHAIGREWGAISNSSTKLK